VQVLHIRLRGCIRLVSLVTNYNDYYALEHRTVQIIIPWYTHVFSPETQFTAPTNTQLGICTHMTMEPQTASAYSPLSSTQVTLDLNQRDHAHQQNCWESDTSSTLGHFGKTIGWANRHMHSSMRFHFRRTILTISICICICNHRNICGNLPVTRNCSSASLFDFRIF